MDDQGRTADLMYDLLYPENIWHTVLSAGATASEVVPGGLPDGEVGSDEDDASDLVLGSEVDHGPRAQRLAHQDHVLDLVPLF